MDAGKSVDATKRDVKMSEYESWGSHRELNVEGMYRYLRDGSKKQFTLDRSK